MQSNPQPLLRSIIGVLTNSVTSLGLAVIANILVTRMLGPEQRGAHAVASILAMTLLIAIDFGMRSALLYNLSRTQDRDEGLREGIAVCSRLLLFSVPLGIVLYSFAYYLGHQTFLKGIGFSLLLASFAYCYIALIQDLVTTVFVGLRDFRGRNLVTLVSAVIYSAVIAAWYIKGLQLTATQALAVQITSTMIGGGVGLVYLIRCYRPRFTWWITPGWRARYLSYGLKSLVSLLAGQANSRLDTFILNALLGNRSVGIYSAAVNVAELSQHMTNAASVVLYPEIGQRSGRDRLQVTLTTIGGSLYVVLLMSLTLAAGMPWILPALYGNAFVPGVLAGMWLLPGMIGMTLFRMLGAVAAAHGKPEYRTYASCVGLVFTVSLDFVLIPRYGLLGAAWASSIAYTACAIFMISLYVRLVRTDHRSVITGLLFEPFSALQRMLSGRIGQV
jgi:O-antigen/teichoic acid export membrane protein